MSSAFAFRCENGTEGGICALGGKCLNNTCTCPDGYQADNVFFHFANCTKPNDFLLYFLIDFTVCTIVMLIIMGRMMLRPNYFVEERRKNISIWAVLMIVTTWMTVLAIFLQNGAFEFAFLYAVCNSCGFCMVSLVLLHILEPLFEARQMTEKKLIMRKSIHMTTVGLVTLLLSLGIAMSCTSRMNPERYNVAAYVYFIAFLTGGMSYPGLVFYNGTLLLQQLQTLMDAKGIPAESKFVFARLQGKIVAVRRGAGAFSAVCVFWYAEVIALPILGSVPFHYLMTFLVVHTMLLLCFGVLVLIKPKSVFTLANVDSMVFSTNPMSEVTIK